VAGGTQWCTQPVMTGTSERGGLVQGFLLLFFAGRSATHQARSVTGA